MAEVLARRFFEPENVRDRSAYRPHVIGIVKGVAKLDETTRKARKEAEKRFLDSFPFHPDLTDVCYSRWTQIEGFQRTRGILRTLATALRDAEPWDRSPIVGPGVLLAEPGATTVSEAIGELAKAATMDSVEGKRTEWVPLLEAELAKAREIQDEYPALAPTREVEQAVVAVFLHSQPAGSKANTPELLRLVGGSAPDAIELEKGLRRWRDTSWFLDDTDVDSDTDEFGGEQQLPKSWRLGNAPNLKQMHDEACRDRVTDAMVEDRLEDSIRKTKSLTSGASAAGARVHLLPKSPKDVPDDGEFRYLVLAPAAVSASGKPSRTAQAFLDHTTGTHKPRVCRNAVVAAVPSREGLEAARVRVRGLLGWQDVAAQLQRQAVDLLRDERLRRRIAGARREIPGIVRQAYGIVVTVNEANQVHAFKLPASGEPLFADIKAHRKARMTDTPVNAEALAPDGPYDLWREGEDSRFANQLSESFARYLHLPKVLRPKLVTDTVLAGVQQGLFVARLARPDGTTRTWWREQVDTVAAEYAALEIVLAEKARLESLSPGLLAAGNLPELWERAEDDSSQALPVAKLLEYFAGDHVATIPQEGYNEYASIPAREADTVLDAARAAVESGIVWLTNPPATSWKETVPVGALNEGAVLRPPPKACAPQDLTQESVPAAWRKNQTTGLALTQALSQQRAVPVPWGLVRDGIGAAVNGRWLVLTDASAPVRSAYDQAAKVVLERPKDDLPPPPPPAPKTATLDVSQLQDLAESASELLNAVEGAELSFRVGVGLTGEVTDKARERVDAILAGVADDLKATRR